MYNLTFVIVTYNGESYIEKCINSIIEFSKNSKIIVIDNNSFDKTVPILNMLSVYKKILLDVNLGFGKANNIGIKEAIEINSDAVFLINQDVYFESGDFENFIRISVNAFKNENFGVISPIHLQINKTNYDYKFKNYISKKNTPNLLNDIDNNAEINKVYESRSVNAAAWIIAMNCIRKVGIFDPIFPHYGEDTDFINRLKYHHLKIGVLPIFKIVHNRRQYDIFDLDSIRYQLKNWSLVYLKNININLFFLFYKYPLNLNRRIKQIENINFIHSRLIFFEVMNYITRKMRLIIKSRKKSKNEGAFLK